MKLQMTLEKEARVYVEKTLKCNISEKLLWSDGGVLFSILTKDKIKKSLFVTSLEDEKIKLKHIYYDIVDASQNGELDFAECETIECKEVITDGRLRGYYIFIVLEQLTPLIETVIGGDFCESTTNENVRKIKLLNAIIDACSGVMEINKKYPGINMFINNEELCLDNYGKVWLLLFDMIKSDIDTKNQAKELGMIMSKMAKCLNVKIELTSEDNSIIKFKKACEMERERLTLQEKNDYDMFLQCIEKTEDNNVDAWYKLGRIYQKGKGVPTDYKQAVYWYEKAAKKKYVKALNNLAYMYQKGCGVEKNYEIAMKYLLEAAKQNDAMAQFNLGIIYQTGKGVEKDIKKACHWYKKSMKKGNKTAKRMYERIKNK